MPQCLLLLPEVKLASIYPLLALSRQLFAQVMWQVFTAWSPLVVPLPLLLHFHTANSQMATPGETLHGGIVERQRPVIFNLALCFIKKGSCSSFTAQESLERNCVKCGNGV